MIELKFTVNNCSLPRMNGCPAAIIIVLLFLQTAFCHETNCFPLILYAGGDGKKSFNKIEEGAGQQQQEPWACLI